MKLKTVRTAGETKPTPEEFERYKQKEREANVYNALTELISAQAGVSYRISDFSRDYIADAAGFLRNNLTQYKEVVPEK